MLKKDEIANPESCLNRAADDEFIFVLREKDPTIAALIVHWIKLRIDWGINRYTDEKIRSAQKEVTELYKRKIEREAK